MGKILEIEKVTSNLNLILFAVCSDVYCIWNYIITNGNVDGIPLDGIALKSFVDVKTVEELIENEKLKIQELLSRRNWIDLHQINYCTMTNLLLKTKASTSYFSFNSIWT